jgi:transaldolase
MSADGADCETVLARFSEAGVKLEALAAQLQIEGAQSLREVVGRITCRD